MHVLDSSLFKAAMSPLLPPRAAQPTKVILSAARTAVALIFLLSTFAALEVFSHNYQPSPCDELTDISSDDSSVSSFETLNDGYSEASQEDAESIGKDSTSSLLNDVGDNQDLDSELSFEAPEEEDQSVVSSEAPSNDEDSVQASDDDETASLGYWDDSEWEEPSDQALFCSNCQQIPFEEIWNGGHHHMKWTEHDSCPICMMIASFVPADCGEPQNIRHYCPHGSQRFHEEHVDCHRPVDIKLSRSGKYDIVVSLQAAQPAPLAVGHLTNLPMQGMY